MNCTCLPALSFVFSGGRHTMCVCMSKCMCLCTCMYMRVCVYVCVRV